MPGLNFCSSVFMFSSSLVLYPLAKFMKSAAAACQECQWWEVMQNRWPSTLAEPAWHRGSAVPAKTKEGEAVSCFGTRALLFSLLFARPGSPGVTSSQTKPRAWERCWQTFTAIVKSNTKWPARVCHKPVWFFWSFFFCFSTQLS